MKDVCLPVCHVLPLQGAARLGNPTSIRFQNGFLNIRLTLFTKARPFDCFFGLGTGFSASRFGVGDGDGDGESARPSELGVAVKHSLQAAGIALRDSRQQSRHQSRSTAATTAAITLSCFFDFSVAVTETETLGKERLLSLPARRHSHRWFAGV